MRTNVMVKTMTLFAAEFVLMLLVGSPALAQFQSQNASLYAWLDLNDLGGAGSGNDCWGYTSTSGREYALMGVSNKLVVVEITDPANPVIVGNVSHSDSLWGDVKVFGDYCYVVNESGGGLDVIDLSEVDSGNITLIQRMTANGLRVLKNRLPKTLLRPTQGFTSECEYRHSSSAACVPQERFRQTILENS